METIRSIGSILQEYTYEKNIPVFGLGSRLPSLDGIYNCFALNGNIFSPGLYTIDKVLEAYKKNTKKLQFVEICKFGDILEYMGNYVSWHTSNGFKQQYFVLLIITTGRISDQKATIERLIEYSTLPWSVIFVGVGDGYFTDMD